MMWRGGGCGDRWSFLRHAREKLSLWLLRGFWEHEVKESLLILGSMREDGQAAPESGPLCVLLAPVVWHCWCHALVKL